jgi:tRNA wybutosine-synthesizing protein 1
MPIFIEVKAYMNVGTSVTRLTRDNMPTHEEVLRFAEDLAKETGYRLVSHSRPSRVALLSKLDKPLIRHGNARISWWDPDYEGEDEYEHQNIYGIIATK